MPSSPIAAAGAFALAADVADVGDTVVRPRHAGAVQEVAAAEHHFLVLSENPFCACAQRSFLGRFPGAGR